MDKALKGKKVVPCHFVQTSCSSVAWLLRVFCATSVFWWLLLLSGLLPSWVLSTDQWFFYWYTINVNSNRWVYFLKAKELLCHFREEEMYTHKLLLYLNLLLMCSYCIQIWMSACNSFFFHFRFGWNLWNLLLNKYGVSTFKKGSFPSFASAFMWVAFRIMTWFTGYASLKMVLAESDGGSCSGMQTWRF